MSTLYKRIVDLCENKGIKPGRMCVDLCLSKSLMTKLRDNENKTITAETAAKIANYFNVPVGYLLGAEEAKEKESIQTDELSDSEKQLIMLLRSLPAETQASFPALFEASLRAQGLL